MAQKTSSPSNKAVIHCDVDCFYCQVELLDNPALANRPLAVHQGNSGGFVAINYKARAAGIRCGDGCDPHNLAAQTFQHNDSKSLPEAQQLCPGLITRPMRSDRYRQVSAQILAVISQHATNGECEKTSYDDFYLEVLPDSSVLITAETWLPAADSEVHVIGGSDFAALPAVLKWAAKVAHDIKSAVHQELALTMSFGIATGKTAARLAGPLHKPSGMTIVPPNKAAAFLLNTPILKVPHLRGQVGKQVIEHLSVEYVHGLGAFKLKELVDLFGAATGQLLFDLGHCIDDKRVQAKGPQQSICCTKSYHGLREFARVEEALQRLVFALWPRLLEERSKSGRLPTKLKLCFKQGGRDQQTRSYTQPFPQTAQSQLKATAQGSVDLMFTQSSAVHTLIPNLAPRSRLQQQGSVVSSNIGRAPVNANNASQWSHQGWQMPWAEEFSKGPDSTGNGTHLLESGPHQAARQAIFKAAMSLLNLKLAEPVLVNFMSVAGSIVSAGDYARDAKHSLASNQGPMSRFLRKEAAVPGCSAAEKLQEGAQLKVGVMPTDQSTAMSTECQSLPKKRTMPGDVSKTQHQSDTSLLSHVKMPRKGIGPMDKFVK